MPSSCPHLLKLLCGTHIAFIALFQNLTLVWLVVMQELIGKVVISKLEAETFKFHAAGREDIDVRIALLLPAPIILIY